MEHRRYFTLEEANQQLSWLAPHVERIAALRTGLATLREEMRALGRKARSNGHKGVEDEMAAKRREVDALRDQVSRLAYEIHHQGVILRDPDRGLVDFAAMREGREVYLCWVMGEEEVRFWHEVDAGFGGRQPL